MDVKAIIIHKLTKNRGEHSIVTKRPTLLPINDKVLAFLKDMKKIYYDKSSKDYGVFDSNTDIYPFSKYVKAYLDGKNDFVSFSHKAMDNFERIINRANLATGGYVVLSHFCSTNEYLSIVMLNDKTEYAIDQKTLELTESIHLELDKLHVANFINLDKWNNNEETYLSFASGNKDVSQYFTEFIGCTETKPSRETSLLFIRTLESYYQQKGYFGNQLNDLNFRVYTFCTDKIKNKVPIRIEDVSRLINPESPDDFQIFASQEDHGLASEFDGHLATIKTMHQVIFISKDLRISFSKSLLKNKVISYNDEENELVIKRLPKQLREQIKNIIVQEADE